MAASLAGRSRRLALEPRDEGLERELSRQIARGLASAGRGSGRSDGGSDGRGGRSRGVLLDRGGGGSGSRGGGRSAGGAVGGSGRGSRGGWGAAGASAVPELGAGDVVGDGGGVGVKDDAVLVNGVQLGTDDTFGDGGSGTRDVDVNLCLISSSYISLTLRVVLGAVGRASSVESDDLVAEDVLASREGGGNSNGPGVVLTDHLDGSPFTIRVTILLDLSPLEGGLVDGGDVTGIRCYIGDDRTHVRFWPGGPVELDGATGSDLGKRVGRTLWASSLVADDVRGAVSIGLDKAIVQVLSVPADVLGDGPIVLLGVVVVELEASGVDTIDGDAIGGAVGGGCGSKSRDGREGGDCLVHLERSGCDEVLRRECCSMEVNVEVLEKSVCRLHTVEGLGENEGKVERRDWCREPKCSDGVEQKVLLRVFKPTVSALRLILRPGRQMSPGGWIMPRARRSTSPTVPGKRHRMSLV
tara:strand:- start:17550 stop:18959 length:1410 start_codon:yes stop_codon:yes gene_type:complete